MGELDGEVVIFCLPAPFVALPAPGGPNEVGAATGTDDLFWLKSLFENGTL